MVSGGVSNGGITSHTVLSALFSNFQFKKKNRWRIQRRYHVAHCAQRSFLKNKFKKIPGGVSNGGITSRTALRALSVRSSQGAENGSLDVHRCVE